MSQAKQFFRRDDGNKQGKQMQFARDGQVSNPAYVRPSYQKKQPVEKPKVEKVEYDGPPRSVFHVDGKGETFAEARKSTEPERKIIAELFQKLIIGFHEHKDKTQLKNEIRSAIFSVDIFTRNRRLIFAIEYCVAGCIVELFEENKEFIQLLKGLLVLDVEIKKREHMYYTMRELQSGYYPDKENKKIIDDLREIFCTPEMSDKMIGLIDTLDPDNKIERHFFGGQVVQQKEQPKKSNTSSKFAIDKDWTRLPVTDADCFEFLEKNPSFIKVEDLGENLVSMNEENMIKASVKHQMLNLFKSLIQKSEKNLKQKKVIVEKSLSYLVDGILNFPMKSELREMVKYLMGMLSYHPLGCYAPHHYPLADKLNEIITKDCFSQQQKSNANFCMDIIKKTNINGLCSKLMNDFVANSMYYGYMGFTELHQFCYESEPAEYIKQFSLVVSNISILRDFIVCDIKKQLQSSTQSGFIGIVKSELEQKLDFLNKQISDCEDKNQRSLIDSRDKLAEHIEMIGKCNNDVFVRFAEKIITLKDTVVDSEMKNEFVKNVVLQIQTLLPNISHCLSQKTLNEFKEYSRKIDKKNQRTIDYFGQDFTGFFLENIKDILATHQNVNHVRTAFVNTFLIQICENISIFEGEKDDDFAKEIQGEFVNGLVIFVRKELNGYINVFNEKLEENEDIAGDKKELYRKIENLKFIFDFLKKMKSPFVSRFEMNIGKIKTNVMNSENKFDLF